MSNQRKINFQIEAFKQRVVVDPKYADKTWKILEHAIHEIYNHNASGLSFEELYRNAYNMVLHKFGENLYTGLVTTMTFHLKEICKSIEEAQGGAFLELLNRKWNDHNKALQMVRDILMYMDRTYVPSCKKTHVHELGLHLWRDSVVHSSKIQTRLLDMLLYLVHKERTGEGFIESCDCGGYLKKAEKPLTEEVERVAHYLDAKSEAKITSVVVREMIANHVQRVSNGLVTVRDVMTLHLREMGKQLLRKGLKGVGEEDVDLILDKVMMLFCYLHEKDVFEKYYKQHLAKRLLSGKTVSDDAERNLIVKLKTECGYQFTSKLEGMFTDMKTSHHTLLGFYNSHPELSEGPTLVVQVLTTSSWPTQPTIQCTLPAEVYVLCEKFRSYYLGTHTGRRLSWQTNIHTPKNLRITQPD
ncbi:PREDICTED: cullin-3B-like [Camelina sativa]|uniref:Cullin-3B-like n=1 Tax=Camelina sativa TaxID=90675 RepID=A0ABM1R2T8_CAMSA|nr:PREDICTED: cullin-3B-like [Camelina sativa]